MSVKFVKMAKTWNFLATLLGLTTIPLNAEGTEILFSEDHEKKLKEKFGDDYVAKMKEALNTEIKALKDDTPELKAIQDEIDAMIAESGLTAEEIAAASAENRGDENVAAQLSAIRAKQKEQSELMQKLISDPLGDKPEAVINNNNNMKVTHSATHLFGSTKEYDALDRPWNRRAVSPTIGATNFTDNATIQKLNSDMELYYRENPTEIKSLTRDRQGLPSFWPTRTKVDDRVADGSIATAEISQARKLQWLPKNKQTIQAEEGKVYPIQIDIEHAGYFLQKIETSWLNMMNKEGSQPYKESFVKFLVSEIDKKARIEDRVATIQGIYVPTPDDATVAGRFINRQNGLLYLLQQARDVTKKYRAFDVGLPTATNIVDYVDSVIKSLPLEVRNNPGLVYYLSEDWLRTYKRRYETLYGLNTDYTGYPTNPKDYPNIKFEPMVDLTGSDLHFITFDDNIEILENVPAEKSMYTFEKLKRSFFIMCDYKLGVRLIHIGNTVDAGDPDEFKVQIVWSNSVPVFPGEPFIPFHENGSTKLKLTYNNYYAAANRTSTVTEIENFAEYKGQVIKIKGNTALAATTNVVHSNSKIKLIGNANFDLKSGGTLTLFVPADGTSVPFEIARTAGPETVADPTVNFTTASIDANLGKVFKFTGGTTTAITSVINGVPGKTIQIIGTDASGVDVTLSTTGNIKLNSSATLGTAADYIELTLINGLWTETKRVIA